MVGPKKCPKNPRYALRIQNVSCEFAMCSNFSPSVVVRQIMLDLREEDAWRLLKTLVKEETVSVKWQVG